MRYLIEISAQRVVGCRSHDKNSKITEYIVDIALWTIKQKQVSWSFHCQLVQPDDFLNCSLNA